MNYLLTGEESKRLKFRNILETDFEQWLPFHQDPASSSHWIGESVTATEACQKWFDKLFYRYSHNLGGMNALLEKSSGKLIGQCGLLIQTVDGVQELEIGYSLLPAYRNKGFATEAAQKCKEYAFEHKLSPSLISIIHIENKASQNVAIKNGMIRDRSTIYNQNPVYIYRVFSK